MGQVVKTNGSQTGGTRLFKHLFKLQLRLQLPGQLRQEPPAVDLPSSPKDSKSDTDSVLLSAKVNYGAATTSYWAKVRLGT